MNKKASIPFGMFALSGIILVIVGLSVMISFTDDLELTSERFSVTEKATFYKNLAVEETKIIAKEAISFCQNCNAASLTEQFRDLALQREAILRPKEIGNFYGKIRNDDFVFEKDETYQLKITGLFLTVSDEENKITKNFDICLNFNSVGDFISECQNL